MDDGLDGGGGVDPNDGLPRLDQHHRRLQPRIRDTDLHARLDRRVHGAQIGELTRTEPAGNRHDQTEQPDFGAGSPQHRD